MNEPHPNRHLPRGGHAPDPAAASAATPARMNTSARPLEGAVRPCRQGHDVAAATLWPVGQQRDGLRRAGRYLPDTSRHPRLTRATLAAYIIDKYRQPGQIVFNPFVGSGTTIVETVYAGRHRIGVDSDPRWYGPTDRDVAFAHRQVASGSALILCGDTREIDPIPRRLRRGVDLVVATPPSRFSPIGRLGPRDDAGIVADLDVNLTHAVRGWMPLLRPAAILVFITRMLSQPGYLLDLSMPIASAAEQAGLQLRERAVALRTSVRDVGRRRIAVSASNRGRRRTSSSMTMSSSRSFLQQRRRGGEADERRSGWQHQRSRAKLTTWDRSTSDSSGGGDRNEQRSPRSC